jgi:hypothetical protein
MGVYVSHLWGLVNNKAREVDHKIVNAHSCRSGMQLYTTARNVQLYIPFSPLGVLARSGETTLEFSLEFRVMGLYESYPDGHLHFSNIPTRPLRGLD